MLNDKFLERMKSYLNDEYEAFLDSYNKPNIRGLLVNNHVITNEMFESIFDLELAKIPYIDNGYFLKEENDFLI